MRKSPKLEDVFVSVVVVTDPTNKGLAKEIERLSKLLRQRYSNYEIILIENRLSSVELTKVSALLDRIACVRVVRLSRQCPRDVCVYVGLEAAIGDVVVIRMLHDPMDLISEFVDKARQADIVFGISERNLRRGVANHYGAKIFYWYNKKFLKISIPENSTYFMALSRKAVNALTRTGRYARHIRYLARQIGYQSEDVYYKPAKAHVQEKRPLSQLIVSALELATSYSKHPLRFWAWLGLIASVLNLLYAFYVIAVNLTSGHVAEGWTTLSLQSAGMFFLLFGMLAILCEYVGKILEETRREPPYHILDELNSKISVADTTRRNVTH